ncbi:hypothetical protein CRG98_024166 [Punica granatum]|uniref:Uncharacterized protein n=1 Tax=Punica granatum TaxID=22663 RepID=A0A2I0JHH0_PUNGR|nr:hypothetical protein CRG98_024166 [Punica granatum]
MGMEQAEDEKEGCRGTVRMEKRWRMNRAFDTLELRAAERLPNVVTRLLSTTPCPLCTLATSASPVTGLTALQPTGQRFPLYITF